MARPFLSQKLAPFGTTIFSEMTKLALEHEAINLSHGFPDFDGPPELIDEVSRAMREGYNQYARSMGHPILVTALAERQRKLRAKLRADGGGRRDQRRHRDDRLGAPRPGVPRRRGHPH
jgi:aspartate/methionine/tyrosine aminotransferase